MNFLESTVYMPRWSAPLPSKERLTGLRARVEPEPPSALRARLGPEPEPLSILNQARMIHIYIYAYIHIYIYIYICVYNHGEEYGIYMRYILGFFQRSYSIYSRMAVYMYICICIYIYIYRGMIAVVAFSFVIVIIYREKDRYIESYIDTWRHIHM